MSEMSLSWNPWHGCTRISEGCKNCWMFSMDKSYDKNPEIVSRTGNFRLPVRMTRDGQYKLVSQNGCNVVRTCFTSDFFHESADAWRSEAWSMIKERYDLTFVIFTKRIHRFAIGLPSDWNDGYDNVVISCSCENQKRIDERLPLLQGLPIKTRMIILAPLLERVNIEQYLKTGKFAEVALGGESAFSARPLDYDWVLDVREQCLRNNVRFSFHQTGSYFIMGGKRYNIVGSKLQKEQARKANINII